MRFDSLEAFLEFYYKNNVNIADVEFNIAGDTSVDPAVTPDVVETPPEEAEVEPQGQKLEESILTLRLASGNVNVGIDANGFMVVEDFDMTPNACGTGHIMIEGRKIHLNMCEMDGKTVAYIHTANGLSEAVAVRRKK